MKRLILLITILALVSGTISFETQGQYSDYTWSSSEGYTYDYIYYHGQKCGEVKVQEKVHREDQYVKGEARSSVRAWASGLRDTDDNLITTLDYRADGLIKGTGSTTALADGTPPLTSQYVNGSYGRVKHSINGVGYGGGRTTSVAYVRQWFMGNRERQLSISYTGVYKRYIGWVSTPDSAPWYITPWAWAKIRVLNAGSFPAPKIVVVESEAGTRDDRLITRVSRPSPPVQIQPPPVQQESPLARTPTPRRNTGCANNPTYNWCTDRGSCTTRSPSGVPGECGHNFCCCAPRGSPMYNGGSSGGSSNGGSSGGSSDRVRCGNRWTGSSACTSGGYASSRTAHQSTCARGHTYWSCNPSALSYHSRCTAPSRSSSSSSGSSSSGSSSGSSTSSSSSSSSSSASSRSTSRNDWRTRSRTCRRCGTSFTYYTNGSCTARWGRTYSSHWGISD